LIKKALSLYGWRARIGLIVPSSNTTLEMDFHKIMPKGVSVHVARMAMPDVSRSEDKVKSLIEMGNDVERAVKSVASVKPSIIVYGCMAGSFVKGIGYDLKLIEELEDITGIKTVSAPLALIGAIKKLKLKRIVIATPYIEELNILEKKYLEKSIPGLRILNIKGLEILKNIPKGKLEPYSAYIKARELDQEDNDGIIISCSNWRTLNIIDVLEKDCKKPVVSNNIATTWATLRALNICEPIKDYGCLLLNHL
jgi:maleate isomerase